MRFYLVYGLCVVSLCPLYLIFLKYEGIQLKFAVRAIVRKTLLC